MLIVTQVIIMMVAAITSSFFITSASSPSLEEPPGIELVAQATGPCEGFGGLDSVYQGEEYTDAFSSVAYFGQGIVVAGKRSWNDYPPNIAIYRSTDYGLTWYTVPNPAGITGRHVYYFGQHNSRVFAGTGDEGSACLMRSDNYGATWSVVLTTADLKALAGPSSRVMAVFTPVYMGGNRWLVNLRNDETGSSPSPLCTSTSSTCTLYFLESLDDGNTWHAFYPTGIDTSARKMILTSDGTLLYAGFVQNHGLYVSRDGGYSFLKRSDFLAFAGMADLGNGVYLAGTYAYPPDAISIYKSNDYGETWSQKKTITLPTAPGYIRTIIKVADDLVIAYASCSEFSQSDRCAEAYMSRDGGDTWTDLGPAFIGPYGNMNAIYDTVMVKPGTFIATAQPDSNILRSINLPPIADAGPDQVIERTSASGAQVSLDGSGSCDPDRGPEPLSFSWIWAGGSASGVSPTVTMPIGTTLVTLEVSDGEFTDTDTATVIVNVPPHAEANGPYYSIIGQSIVFSSTGSNDPDPGDTMSYDWNWGDGSPHGTGASPTHTYTTGGSKTVTLTITDNHGATGMDTATVNVNVPPHAEANGPYSGSINQVIVFSSAGSNDPDGSIDSYNWNWGDGTPHGSGSTPSHSYTSAGTKTVTLMVTDNGPVAFATDTDTATVNIRTPCEDINNLKAMVTGMTLTPTIRTALNTRLNKASTLCAKGPGQYPAIATLFKKDFIPYVNSKTRKGITPAQATTLLDQANLIIAACGG
jgi:PKD repeat protein